MLTGQETISELLENHPKAQEVLYKYGLTREAEEYFKYQNLTHAALILKIPLRKILEELAVVTGEAIKKPKVSGIPAPRKSGLNRFGKPAGVKRVIAIHSGKGGVGKTFVALNLAAALAEKGAQVGLLDADIDCPNVMKILRLQGKFIADAEKKIIPLEKDKLKIVSMAPLLEHEEQVLLWRGPIVSRALEQFLYDVAWGELDYLIVDLPPGTSDIPITLYHTIKQTELIGVATPQELALLDAKKSLNMAQQMKIKIVGLVENMSGKIFGKDNVRQLTEELGIPFLGNIELNPKFTRLQEKAPVLQDKGLKKVFEQIIRLLECDEEEAPNAQVG